MQNYKKKQVNKFAKKYFQKIKIKQNKPIHTKINNRIIPKKKIKQIKISKYNRYINGY